MRRDATFGRGPAAGQAERAAGRGPETAPPTDRAPSGNWNAVACFGFARFSPKIEPKGQASRRHMKHETS